MKVLVINIMKCALRIIYAPMKLLPMKEKIVYLSRQSNEKSLDMLLLSNEIAKNNPETIQIFRLKMLKKGLKGSMEYVISLLGDIYHIATAKVVICDTYSIPVSCLRHKNELKVLQIWHALGAVKKFGLQSLGKKEGRDESISRAMQMHENYTYVMAPSEATAQFYKEAFGVTEENICLLSLPRVDYVLQPNDKREKLVLDNPRLKDKNLVLYLPTFRENEERIVEVLNEAFQNDEKNALIVSLHPLSKVRNKKGYGIEGEYNVFDLIKCADAVITDYSACAFETAVAGKKLYFYVPDYEKYQMNRGLNIDLMAEMSPYVFKNVKDLKNSIDNKDYDYMLLKGFQKKYVSETEQCTKRMGEFVCNLMIKR